MQDERGYMQEKHDYICRNSTVILRRSAVMPAMPISSPCYSLVPKPHLTFSPRTCPRAMKSCVKAYLVK